ncbi:protein FAM83A [Alosa sapidissima]|uniref:protein FAM83A n=1 Tax=Alosa sapidissima TaxID=34773 RepID=UPI001C0A02F1|nr:protein FAM83A [Alosa sapidissima]
MEPKKDWGSFFQPKPVGKMRRRLLGMQCLSLQETSAPLDLSHSESARLATDALLNGGLGAYKEVLAKDGEVDFLSRREKNYILGNVSDTGISKDGEDHSHGPETDSDSSQTYLPSATEGSPPELDHGWPSEDSIDHLQGIPAVDVHFQTNGSSMKDMLRQFINEATKVLAIVMDTFSDIEIFCDILEAMRKRNVSVYLLLDHLNLPIFLEMCNNLQINASHIPKMSVRSVPGQTYCAKSGKKFKGQIQEKFIIADCTQVLFGSYSFTWLSWRVHRSLAMLFKGSGVKPFDLEFRRLYAASLPVKELPAAEVLNSLSLYMDTKCLNSQPSTISSSDSASTELEAAVQGTAVTRQCLSSEVLKDPRLPSPEGQPIFTVAQSRYQTVLPAPSKALPPGPLVGPGLRHKWGPSPGPATVLPPRLQWLLTQRHSSFPKDHGVSALPWRPAVVNNNNNNKHSRLFPQTAGWATTQR